MTGRDQRGQALPVVMFLGALLVGAGWYVFTLGRAQLAQARAQAGADLVAVGTGRHIRRELTRLAAVRPSERDDEVRRIRRSADELAAANGVRLVRLAFPEAGWPPTGVQVAVAAPGPLDTTVPAVARAVVVPGAGALTDAAAGGASGEYRGPLVTRDGKPTCPAVAAAFDRMDAAARRSGVDLVVTSGFRSDREQAILFRRHPDPKWVAPPGRSRHRNATELDIGGTPGAWDWLAANARRFGFLQRYSWEPWHYGYLPGCGAPDGPAGTVAAPPPDASSGGLPSWVPARYRPVVERAASAGGVPPVVLASLIQAESGWNARAVSPAGALGIAQFMPATARGMGLADPFDPDAAILAAGRLLGGHLRRFGSIPLALAAYNAGPGAVARYGGVPPYAETRAYVSRIMALAGDPSLAAPGPDGDVVLVRIDGLLV